MMMVRNIEWCSDGVGMHELRLCHGHAADRRRGLAWSYMKRLPLTVLATNRAAICGPSPPE